MHPSSLVLLAIGSAVYAADTVKDKPAGGYYGGAAAAPAQQGYAPQQPVYPAQQPVYYQPVYQPAPYALANYDVNYCTVHASFPLVDRHRKHKHHRRDRRQTYGNFQQPAASYPSVPAYGPAAYPPVFGGHHNRRFDRQYCRHTAVFSQDACNTCCQISSRAAGSENTLVSGALFVFDPNMDWDRRDRDSRESEERTENDEDKRILQCVCCMPKSV